MSRWRRIGRETPAVEVLISADVPEAEREGVYAACLEDLRARVVANDVTTLTVTGTLPLVRRQT